MTAEQAICSRAPVTSGSFRLGIARVWRRLAASLLLAAGCMTLSCADSVAQQTDMTDTQVPPSQPEAEVYTAGVFDDWSVRCARTAAGDACEMFQIVNNGEIENGTIPLAEVMARRVAPTVGSDLAVIMDVVVPLGVLIPAGLRVSVDGGKEEAFPFLTCMEQGCLARVFVSESKLAEYKRGARAKLKVRPYRDPDRTVAGVLSLYGFTAALGETP